MRRIAHAADILIALLGVMLVARELVGNRAEVVEALGGANPIIGTTPSDSAGGWCTAPE